MKKVLLTLLGAAACIGGFAQERVASYHANNSDYYVELGSMDSDGDYRYYIEVVNTDPNVEEVNICMYQFTAEEFLTALDKAKATYIEWTEKAKSNKVKSVDKKMDVDFPTIRAGFSYGGWEFVENKVSPRFKVRNGEYKLVLTGDPIKTDTYTCKGYEIVFTSPEDIDSFAQCFDKSIAEKHYGTSIKTSLLAPTSDEGDTVSISELTSYHSDYFDKDFQIKVGIQSGNDFNYYIETASSDPYIPEVSLCIPQSEIGSMLDALTKAREYYSRWSDVAQQNNITDFDKTIDVKFPEMTGTFVHSGSSFSDDGKTTVTPRFRVMEGKYLLILTGSEIITDYIDCDGFYITFESTEEIDNFIKCFDSKLADDHFKSANAPHALFN